jgi:hypothetical protein
MNGDPKAARGYRNRNPGNIEHVPANKWLGLADPPSDGRFCRFHSHQHGIRALALLLQSYQDRHGLRTVRGIVARWAPSTENNTRAYQDAVARRLAVGLDDPIDLHDAATLRGLVEAIIRHELGGQPYAPDVIAEGLRLAGLVEPGIARTGTVRAAAGAAAAGLTAATVLEAVELIAPHADGLASVARALGPWGVALAVAGAAAWAIVQRLQRQREIVP